MPLKSRLFARLERAGCPCAQRAGGPDREWRDGAGIGCAEVPGRPVRRQPVVDDAEAQPQECIEGQVFDVMRVQASDRQASWKTQMASTNQRPRTATLAAYVPTSGFIRMPGVNPLPHGSSDSPQ